MALDEALEAGSAFGRLTQEPTRQRFENPALERHQLAVVDQRLGAQSIELGNEAGRDDGARGRTQRQPSSSPTSMRRADKKDPSGERRIRRMQRSAMARKADRIRDRARQLASI